MKALIVHEKSGSVRVDPGTPRDTDITKEEIENATGINATNPKYPFMLMGISEAFRAESATIGDPKLMCCRKNGLHILTDSEAAIWTDGNFWLYLHRAIRTHENGVVAIREDKLDAPTRSIHNDQVARRSRMVQSIKAEAGKLGESHRLRLRKKRNIQNE